MPTNAAEMTPEQKIEFLEDQVWQARTGQINWMLCPYCGGESRKEKVAVCCAKFAAAVEAILDRIDKRDAVDFMENVADRTSKTVNVSKYVN